MKTKLFTLLLAVIASLSSASAGRISTTDKSIEDWKDLDMRYVFIATLPEEPLFSALKEIRVYADPMYINYILKFDPDEMPSHTPVDALQIFLNADNSDATGGYWDLFDAPNQGNTDLMFEGAIWDDDGNQISYNPNVSRWAGPLRGEGWYWEYLLVADSLGESQFVEDGIIEGRLNKHNIPWNQWTDSFEIGFSITQNWEPVGLLPQASSPTGYHLGRAGKLSVTFDLEYLCTISTSSANPEWGTTAGDTTVTCMSDVEISATPNYGYHFVHWNDGSTSNPRTISATKDKTYTATFAKNVYSITKNAEHGTISGNSSAEYLDEVTLTANPDYGYHFTQWSDGLKDNPRIFQITSDTAFTAEFAYDRVGTCGKDLALTWSYDPTNKVLTIGNAGSFTENMQFGAEAPGEMEELVIGNSVTAIGANAFAGISTLKKVTIGESVKTIGEQAFYNCVNLETIFNYRPTPTNTYSNAFDGVDKFECTLYVLPNSIDMYKAAAVWRDFYYTYAIGAKEATVTTNDVKVEPQDNAATLTWPTSNNAASYTIEITKEGIVFCTLTFNANGQLTGIAFAPSRDGQAHAPAAIMTANGLQFTVTGLNSGTQYGYNLTAKDANDQTVATYSGSFTTTSEGEATGVDNVPSDNVQCTKVVHNGQIFILRDGKAYTLTGQLVR